MNLKETLLVEELYALAKSSNKEDFYFQQAYSLNDFLNKHREEASFIISKEYSLKEKKNRFQELFNHTLDRTFMRVFFKVSEKTSKEYTELDLLHDFLNYYLKEHGITFGAVYSASSLSESQLKEFEEAYSLKFKYQICFENKIDPALIGGFKVVINDEVWDGSYRNKLEDLKNKLNKEHLDLEPGSLVKRIEKEINSFDNKFIKKQTADELGKVLSVGDGIVHVSGINKAMAGEVLQIEDKARALVMDLKEDEIAAILLDDAKISKGNEVYSTKQVIKVPVGDGLLGRVVDGLGQPIDGKGKIAASDYYPIERASAGIIDRQAINEPLYTGTKIIDSLIPIGKGQRELIIGDRQTGKTTIALDAIINQKGRNVKCIYVAIGQRTSAVAYLIEKLQAAGALEYTTVVLASASDLEAKKYLAPYGATSMGEYWMEKGDDVLIIYDDLSKHATSYRTISLLLRRPPGREAYPGDIFYLHSRLLERSGRLNESLGGGSLSAIPIVETQAGDISAYIPTNVISITDGQLFLQTEMFNAGNRPAIDYGLSVSRVGSSAQTKLIRSVASSLKLDLSTYQEVSSFAQFGSDLDQATRSQIDHGNHLVELLKQGQNKPVKENELYVLLFANVKGFIDKIELKNIKRFNEELIKDLYLNHNDFMKRLLNIDKPNEEIEEFLLNYLKDFTSNFH